MAPVQGSQPGLNQSVDQRSTLAGPAPSTSTTHQNAFDPLKLKFHEDGTPFLSGDERGQKRLRADDSGFESRRRRLLRRARSCEDIVEKDRKGWAAASGQQRPPSPRDQPGTIAYQVGRENPIN